MSKREEALKTGVLEALRKGKYAPAMWAYNKPPEGAKYPYANVGPVVATSSQTTPSRLLLEVTVWSNSESQLQVKELMGQVDNALSTSLTVAQFDIIVVHLCSAGVVRQWYADGSLFRGRLTYAITMAEK